MANVEYTYNDYDTVKGTAGDDMITVTGTAAGANTVEVVGGAGSDTVVFDGALDGTTFDRVATGFTAGTGQVDLTGVEAFQFTNGTVTFNAALDAEMLSESALRQAAGSDWAVDNVLVYNGASVGNSTDDWSLSTVAGQTLTGSNTVTILNDGVVQGSVSFSTVDENITFTADSALQSSLDVGEEAEVSFEVALTNEDGDTFTETFTAVVTGSVSSGDDIYRAADDASAVMSLEAGNDRGFGGAAADTIIGNAGDDTLSGGAGNDVLIGNSVQSGNAGPVDVLTSGDAANDDGANVIYGGADNDLIAAGGFDDGDGATLSFNYDDVETAFDGGVASATLAGYLTGEKGGEAYGGAGDDIIFGTASGDDLIFMGDGNDSVLLNDGDNTVYAGATDTGADVVKVEGDGDNTLYVGGGADEVTVAGDGDNTIGLGDGGDTLTITGAGNNTIYTGTGDLNTVTVGAGDDTIYSGTGDNTINLALSAGEDVIVFSGGDDTFTNFQSGTDMIDVAALGISNFDNAIIIEDDGNTGTLKTTIVFDDETSISYDAAYDIDDFIF